jgi:outer membrane protein assembly factor BamD (BamD/ComL family)
MRLASFGYVAGLTGAMLGAVGGCAIPRAPDNPTPHVQSLTQAGETQSTGQPVAPPKYPGQQTAAIEPQSPRSFDAAVRPDSLDSDGDGTRSWADRMAELTPTKIKEKFKDAVGLGPDEPIARAAYAQAEVLFNNGRYAQAAKSFKTAADRWPDSALEEDALFMLAESQFLQNKYSAASDTYTNLMKKYNNSRHADRIMNRRFAIARYWDQLGQKRSAMAFNFTDRTLPFWDTAGNAVALYESIRLDDPTGPLADDATMATANSHFLRGHYEDAAFHYDLLRKEFPQSEFQPQAHLLGMRSKLLSYQGPVYDDKPLKEAKQLSEQLTAQFGDQLEGEKEHIRQAQREMEAQLAERIWVRGEYYYQGKFYRAARDYYQAVIKEYPDSRFAQMARDRLAETKDLPDQPKNGVEWLTSKFSRDKPKTTDQQAIRR